MRKIITSLILLLAVAVIAEATLIKEYFPKGFVDWSSGIIQIKARNRGMTGRVAIDKNYQVALDDAFADYFLKARETITGLRVNQNTLAGDIIAESEVLAFEIERLIRQAQINRLQYNLDGSVSLEAVIPLFGPKGVGTVVFASKLGSAIVSEIPDVIPFLHLADKSAISADGAVYTGLIIDASMYELNPALLPGIYDQSKQLIYGGEQSSSLDEIRSRGLVGYVSTIKEATDLVDRVGSNPLIIKAAGVGGSFKTDVILFQSDASRVLQVAKEYNFFKQASVVVVIKR